MFKFYSFSLFFFFVASLEARVERISSQFFNLSKTQKIHLYPNRVSLIQFPCAVQKTISGSSLDLNVRIDNNTPQELYLWLKSAKAEPTNLIVKCQEKFFIFDIYAQKHSHQDYIKILSGFQSPKLKLKKIDGSGKKARKP